MPVTGGAGTFVFLMIVALAAPTAFMTLMSSPMNSLVVALEDYLFDDFVRVGLPF